MKRFYSAHSATRDKALRLGTLVDATSRLPPLWEWYSFRKRVMVRASKESFLTFSSCLFLDSTFASLP